MWDYLCRAPAGVSPALLSVMRVLHRRHMLGEGRLAECCCPCKSWRPVKSCHDGLQPFMRKKVCMLPLLTHGNVYCMHHRHIAEGLPVRLSCSPAYAEHHTKAVLKQCQFFAYHANQKMHTSMRMSDHTLYAPSGLQNAAGCPSCRRGKCSHKGT